MSFRNNHKFWTINQSKKNQSVAAIFTCFIWPLWQFHFKATTRHEKETIKGDATSMLAAQYLIKQLQSKWFRKKTIFLNCISSEVSQLMEKIIQGLNFYFLIIFSLQLYFFFFIVNWHTFLVQVTRCGQFWK